MGRSYMWEENVRRVIAHLRSIAQTQMGLAETLGDSSTARPVELATSYAYDNAATMVEQAMTDFEEPDEPVDDRSGLQGVPS